MSSTSIHWLMLWAVVVACASPGLLSRWPEVSAMRLEDRIRGLITILVIALCSSRSGLADDLDVLHYDHPIAEDLKRLDHSVPRSQINNKFMTQALPLGNGRFGAMFSGHVGSEYLVFTDYGRSALLVFAEPAWRTNSPASEGLACLRSWNAYQTGKEIR